MTTHACGPSGCLECTKAPTRSPGMTTITCTCEVQRDYDWFGRVNHRLARDPACEIHKPKPLVRYRYNPIPFGMVMLPAPRPTELRWERKPFPHHSSVHPACPLDPTVKCWHGCPCVTDARAHDSGDEDDGDRKREPLTVRKAIPKGSLVTIRVSSYGQCVMPQMVIGYVLADDSDEIQLGPAGRTR